jgi:GT2 family glycosyltransferase
MAPTIDVVIVAFNRFELIDRCLRHLDCQTVPCRTIVVDNGSTDGLSDRVSAAWPDVHVERFEHGRGFGEASNFGASAGGGEVIVLLNNDVDCRPDFLERLVAPLQSDPGIGAVAPLMLQPGERLIDSVGLTADVTLAGFPRHQGLPVERAALPRPALTCPAGTAAAYRRTAWEQVGGLDAGIFAYMEDLDLGLRLHAQGWSAAVAIDAVGVHLGSATHVHRSASQRRHGGFGRGWMLRRYRVLEGRHASRAVLTEAIAVIGDMVISHDLAALRGRLAGWLAARDHPRLPRPPAGAIDQRISLRASLTLRRGVYGRRAV